MTSARSLRAQLMRASMTTTGVALLVSAVAMLTYEYFSFRGERELDLRAQAEMVAKAVEPALLFQDPKSADLQLESLREKQGLLLAEVFDSRGAPFAKYPPDTGRISRKVPPLYSWDAPGSRYTGSTLELAYGVEHEGERVGMVYLVVEHDITGRIINYATILIAVVVGGLALAWLVFGRLQRVVIDPLLTVTEVALQVMDQRDWSLRAPLTSSSREVEVLVNSFNRMLAEVQIAQSSLLGADRKKDVFLATLAHELRNPLAPMTMAVHILQRANAPPAVRQKSVEILSRQLKQATRLIDDLLDVSRIATGKLSLRSEPVDLANVVRLAAELFEPIARDRNLSLKSLLPSEPCMVSGDSARLQQIFTNLLANACRYTPEGGRIEVSLTHEMNWVRVSVSDTGIGIDPSMQEAVFELFEQADKRLERGNSGLGLGLTLARQLVRLHRGAITLESEGEGRGAMFTVSLPRLAGSDREAQVTQEATRADRAAVPLSLVVADDNVDFALTLHGLLTARGHDVEVVHDGLVALQTILSKAPNVAILDIGMPGLNGYEVARRVRQSVAGRQLLLVAVSGWGQLTDKQRAEEAGFDHHLTKPIEIDQLVRLLEDQPLRHSNSVQSPNHQ